MKLKIPAVFKKTNPRWTKKIEKRDTFEHLTQKCIINRKKLDIANYSCCIVGEARNLFDKSYERDFRGIALDMHGGCQSCTNFSMNIHTSMWSCKTAEEYSIRYSGTTLGQAKRDLEKILLEFTKHMEEEHSEMIPA